MLNVAVPGSVIRRGVVILALAAFGVPACSAEPDPGPAIATAEPQPGGRLVMTYRTEPTNYNRLAGDQSADEIVRLLTQDTLVRLNRATGDLEPRLAERWTASDDGLAWTLDLRPGVTWSDGTPFTPADILFTVEALYDAGLASSLASSFLVADQPLTVRAIGDRQIEIRFPAPYGPGLAILDGLPILPAHVLAEPLAAGTLREAWAAGTQVSSVAGLGPFVLAEHAAGQSVRFVRNERFWNTDDEGRGLPYLDEVVLRVVPEQNAEILQLESGNADLISDFIRAEDIAALRRRAADGAVQLVEAGISPSVNGLWFNLGSASVSARPWMATDAFRRAVSTAVDRQAIVETVYLGEAVPVHGPVTRGYGEWHVADLPAPSFDQAAARRLLAEAGLADSDGDGVLDDGAGRPARLSIVTQAGHDERTRTVSMVEADLEAVGLDVTVELMDQPTLIGRYMSGDYDAIYFAVNVTAPDPMGLSEFWLSSGGMHFWNPGQSAPATDWEARIDDLFRRQMTTVDHAERVALFADAQRVLAEHLPIVHFAAPKVWVATSGRLGGVESSVFIPPVLWNVEELFVTAPLSGAANR